MCVRACVAPGDLLYENGSVIGCFLSPQPRVVLSSPLVLPFAHSRAFSFLHVRLTIFPLPLQLSSMAGELRSVQFPCTSEDLEHYLSGVDHKSPADQGREDKKMSIQRIVGVSILYFTVAGGRPPTLPSPHSSGIARSKRGKCMAREPQINSPLDFSKCFISIIFIAS